MISVTFYLAASIPFTYNEMGKNILAKYRDISGRKLLIEEYKRHSYLWEEELLPGDEREQLARLSKAAGNEELYHDENMQAEIGRYSTCLKTNDALEFGVVTGCPRISKESIFTGLNHLEISSVYNNGL